MRTFEEICKLVLNEYISHSHNKTSVYKGICAVAAILAKHGIISWKEKIMFIEGVYIRKAEDMVLGEPAMYLWDENDRESRVKWMGEQIKTIDKS